uniref:DUF834 domain-containing protein n=1 Tax=Oryza meridionalis TaxID=40149 RepID=A0A0E0E1L9_9ORYZ
MAMAEGAASGGDAWRRGSHIGAARSATAAGRPRRSGELRRGRRRGGMRAADPATGRSLVSLPHSPAPPLALSLSRIWRGDELGGGEADGFF